MNTQDIVLGIDAGTGGLRACLFALDGTLVGEAEQTYETRYPHVGWAVQRPEDWFTTMRNAVRGALQKAGISGERVIGLSIDAPCDIMLVDDAGVPLTDGLMWMDLRGAEQAHRLTATGADVLKYAGGVVAAEWPLPKALWLKEHEPALWAKATHLVEQMTWMSWRLTGEWVQPLNSAAAKWQYRANGEGWPVDLMRRVGMEDAIDKLPKRVVEMGGVGGYVTEAAAAELGLKAGTPVSMSGIDAHTGMIGVDTLEPGTLALITGTSTCQLAQSAGPIFDPGLWGPFENAVINNEWTIEAGQASTGGTVRWLLDLVGSRWSGADKYKIADKEAADAGPGAEGLTILDYWQGSRTPIRDSSARGTITGLTTGHGPGHLLRAVYEATAYGNKRILDVLTATGVPTKRIVACGGGVRSALWLQIITDIAGVPMAVNKSDDAVALGTAICAAVGAKAFSSLREGARAMVHADRVIEPNMALTEVYAEGYERYKLTYEALAPLFASAAQVKQKVGAAV